MNRELLSKYNINADGDLYSIANGLESVKRLLLQRLNAVEPGSDMESVLDKELVAVEEELLAVTNTVLSFDDVELESRDLNLTEVSSAAEDKEKGEQLWKRVLTVYAEGLKDLTLEQLKAMIDEAIQLNHGFSMHLSLLIGAVLFDSVFYMRKIAEGFRKGTFFDKGPDMAEAEYWDRRANYFEHYAENRLVCEEYRFNERLSGVPLTLGDTNRLMSNYMDPENGGGVDVAAAWDIVSNYPLASINFGTYFSRNPEYYKSASEVDRTVEQLLVQYENGDIKEARETYAKYCRLSVFSIGTYLVINKINWDEHEIIKTRLTHLYEQDQEDLDKVLSENDSILAQVVFLTKVYIGKANEADAKRYLSLDFGNNKCSRLNFALDLFVNIYKATDTVACPGALYVLLMYVMSSDPKSLGDGETFFNLLGLQAYLCMLIVPGPLVKAGYKPSDTLLLQEAYANSRFSNKKPEKVSEIVGNMAIVYSGEALGIDKEKLHLPGNKEKGLRYAKWYLAFPEEYKDKTKVDIMNLIIKKLS